MALPLPNPYIAERQPQENFDKLASQFPVRTHNIDDDAVTAAKIAADAVGPSELNDAELEAIAGLTSAANKMICFTGSGTAELRDLISWTTWSPTLGGITVGNGVTSARYCQIDKAVFFEVAFTFGTTSAVTGNVTATLPVTAAALVVTRPNIGTAELRDDSAAGSFVGTCRLAGTTSIDIRHMAVSGTAISASALTSLLPFTWATSDQIQARGFYEAA